MLTQALGSEHITYKKKSTPGKKDKKKLLVRTKNEKTSWENQKGGFITILPGLHQLNRNS